MENKISIAKRSKAGFWIRFFAHFIDGSFLSIPILGSSFGYLFYKMSKGNLENEGLDIFHQSSYIMIAGFILFEIYQILSIKLSGKTLGRQILKVKIVKLDKLPISYLDAVKRRSIITIYTIFYILSYFECIGKSESCSIRYPLSEISISFSLNEPITSIFSCIGLLLLANIIMIIRNKISLQDSFAKTLTIREHQ
jgi:uncharacterized RDD family membrane protein YckC